jgi:histidinol-phosphatase (PHP family)
VYDYHVHSNYSDGRFLGRMVRAAVDAGLEGVGFADHCNVSEREHPRRYRRRFGFNLDLTHERRREAIREYESEHDVRVFDAVEVDYHPADEDAIAAFLDEAGFEYAVGSVHEVREANVHRECFADLDEAEQRAAVDEYFDRLVALVESGLFDIVAHPDIVERNPALRGYATEDHYRAVAAALADSDAVPEMNAGRVDREYGKFHPNPAFLSVLAEYDVPVTLGSDAHSPDALRERTPLLGERLAEVPVETVELPL